MKNDRAAQAVKDACQLYDMEEDSIVTELKVLHPSYALPNSNVIAMLTCLKVNDVDTVFPKLTKLFKICYIASDSCTS